MSVQYKDYYQVLGVARTASEDDIRKAFRKLAREYHPDVAKDKKTAEDKFKEINEAYEVLSDPEKRKKYDELGADWKQGAEFRPPPGWGGQGQRRRRRSNGGGGTSAQDFETHFGGTGFSDFFEQFFSSGGQGRSYGFRNAEDFVDEQTSQRGNDLEADIMVTLEEAVRGSVRTVNVRRNVPCGHCQGTGVLNEYACPQCRGEGYVAKLDNYQVKVPAGVRAGQKLRLAGKGEIGHGRGQAGDLYLNVRFARHPDFTVDGSDLSYDVDLAPWEAVLGTNVDVPTLHGKVAIKIPAGTNNGQKLRVRGKGLPVKDGGHGDLYVVVQIKIPAKVTEAEKELWEKLAKTSDFKPRE